jgi:microsomal dipeptidase-like Zn-dependent dipeptidase
MALPGQQFTNGASNYLFGSNVPPDYTKNTIVNTPQIQQLIKQAGIMLLRVAITDKSSDAEINARAEACANCGCAMLVILPHHDLAFGSHVISLLGDRCNLYELSNEPDLNNISCSQYLSYWNEQIPVWRKINPNAAFIGPALGVFSNLQSYLIPWLKGCQASGNLPDGVSYHMYPCYHSSRKACAAKAPDIGSAATTLRNAVISTLGFSLPICCTEWNIDPSSRPPAYTTQPSFVAPWFHAAIESMVANKLDMACQFDAGSGDSYRDMVSTTTYQPQADYQPMVDEICKYLSTPEKSLPMEHQASFSPLRLDFESGDLSFWTAEGQAFLQQPIRGDRFVTSQVKPGLIPLGGDYWDGLYHVGHQGNYWISTQDHLTGTLTSDEFTITKAFSWFSCLISGSDDRTAHSASLLIKATEINRPKLSSIYPLVHLDSRGDFYKVFEATGHGNEIMRRVIFNAEQFAGEQACIRVIDTAPSGHINVDDFQFSSDAPQTLPDEAGGGDPTAPVWGFADLHTHPMSHLAFGGVIFWGEVEGSLETALPWCTPVHGIGGTGIAGGEGNIIMSFFEQTGYGLDIGHAVGGYPQFDGWPRFTSLVHQQMHIDWIRRAYDGGLRLMVAHAVNNEMLANQYNGRWPYDDRTAVETQLTAMKELVARHSDWMEIAYTPADARRIIHANKLAIVLGVEVDSLGDWKDPRALTEAEIVTYLDHLYHDLGVRHLFPVHQANNVFAGAAIYNDLFSLVNHFLHNDYFHIEDGSALGVEFRLEEDPGPAIEIARITQDYHPPYSQISGGHVNTSGLSDLGRFFIQQMMRLGMLIEVDHMSHKAVEETLLLAEQHDYPLVAGHTSFRELAWKRYTETESIHKCSHEGQKTAEQAERIRKLGGIVAPIACQQDIRDVGDVLPALKGKVRDDSAGSSKTWAQAYLYAVEKMGGRGVGIGTDTNGFAKFTGPRFGLNASYFLDFDVAGMGRDPKRRLLRREQVEAQGNGVRYSDPLVDARRYRFEGVLQGDVYDDMERDIWQAVGLYKAGRNPWKEQNICDAVDRVVNFAKGFFATSDDQLLRPGLLTCDAPWEQRAAFLVKTGEEPGNSDRDPQAVHEIYPKVLTIWQMWQAMEGKNTPLTRSRAGGRDFDINLDGVAHYGMLPDLVQDLKNVGLTDEDLQPFFRSAEHYIQTWERAEEKAKALRSRDTSGMPGAPARE